MRDRLLNTAQAAEYLGVSPSTLNHQRCPDYAPKRKAFPRVPYVRVGRRVFYQKSDLDAVLLPPLEL